MTDLDPDDKDAFLAATSGDELQQMRITTVVRAELDRMRAIRATARDVTDAAPGAVHRVRRRLVHGPVPRTDGLGAALRWPVALGAVAAAVVIAFVVGRPDGPPIHRLGQRLGSGDVALQLDGLGTVGGTPEAPEIRWESGRLAVEVTPNRGVHLAVVTPEATVRVIGTAFTVDRAAFATLVNVTHGTVEVTCAGEPPVRVPAPGARTCLPDDPAALLRRVTALRRDGAPVDERLASIDAGLAAAGTSGPIAAELLAHRAEVLGPIRPGDAIDAALRYLALGGPRQAEMAELAVGLAPAGCAGEPVLERAVMAVPSGWWAVSLAACVIDRDPDRARRLLDQVDDPGPLAALASALSASLSAPPGPR
ncbi:MAG: FecR domain-containing protein [Myxococcota bacterium]